MEERIKIKKMIFFTTHISENINSLSLIFLFLSVENAHLTYKMTLLYPVTVRI